LLIARFQFNLRDNQPGVFTQKLIHLPNQIADGNARPALFQHGADAKRVEHLGRLRGGDRVFVFAAFRATADPLDGDPGAIARQSHPHRARRIGGQITLANENRLAEAAPTVSFDQEFAFDFFGHETRWIGAGSDGCKSAAGNLRVASLSFSDFPTIVVVFPCMKIATFLLLGLLIYAVLSTHFTVRRCQSEKERAFAIRISAFSWLVGFFLLVAFLFLPNKQRVLMLLPVFLAAVTLAKFWRNSRERLRREQQAQVDLERMKRVN